MTYVPTAEGCLYLAVVENLFSRRIVGRAMDATMTSRLTVDALKMAVGRRVPGRGQIAHSDRGSHYASDHYQHLLASEGIASGMSGWRNVGTTPRSRASSPA